MSNSIFEKNTGASSPDIDQTENREEGIVAGEVTKGLSDDNSADDDSLLELLSHMKGIIDDENDYGDEDEDLGEGDMDADDYHNKAVGYARRGRNRLAAEVCIDGLKHFPLNVDLLASTIKYSAAVGDMETASRHYTILKNDVPAQRWNWRAFTFSFDYLIKGDPIANEKECRILVENYKKYVPYEEKACLAESELEMALGNAEHSMRVLEEAIVSHANASQCALRLADMQLDRGLYEKVIITANYGIAASAEVQPSINIPYLYYIRALAKDYILHKKEYDNETVEAEDVDALAAEYELLLSEFPELTYYEHNINMRAAMLKFMKTT